MSYTLEQFAKDAHDAIAADPGPKGREKVRQCLSKALMDDEFISKHLGDQATSQREILYEDPDFGFVILAHVYKGPKDSSPHDHGHAWAIYGQGYGETTMNVYRKVKEPKDGQPGLAAVERSYVMKRGDAYLYNEGDLHSPHRTSETRLIRIEGVNMETVKRDKYEVAPKQAA